jgi:hypothetical protein
MSYWKGLGVAVAIDLIWIMGSPLLAPDAKAPRSTTKAELAWVMNPADAPPPADEQQESEEVDRLIAVSEALDSLMMHLQMEPEDVDAIEKVADIYASNGWWDEAIGPLARAIQLDPERWSLWPALDRAVEKAGMAAIADAELTVRAQNFIEEVEMWGHGC